MREKTIIEVMSKLGANDFTRSGDHVMTNCVYAPYTGEHRSGYDHNPSAGIKITNGVSPYHCFSCGKKKGVLDVVREVGRFAVNEGNLTEDELDNLIALVLLDEQEVSEIAQERKKETNPVEESILECLGSYHEYMADNGISKQDAELFKLGYSPQEGRILFPIITKKGEIPLVQGRTLKERKGTPKYKIYPRGAVKSDYLYGEHLITEDTEYGIIVEGNKDVIQGNKALKEAGLFPIVVAVGINGSSISGNQATKILGYFQEAILGLDNDNAGMLGEQEFYKKYWRRLPISKISYPEGVSDMDEYIRGNGSMLELLNTKKMYIEKELTGIMNSITRRLGNGTGRI